MALAMAPTAYRAQSRWSRAGSDAARADRVRRSPGWTVLLSRLPAPYSGRVQARRVTSRAASDLRLEAGGVGRAPRQLRGKRIAYLRDVTLHLVRRDLALRYRGTVLGWFWSLAPVVLQLIVTQFLFTRVIPLGVPNSPVFLLIGILAWNHFAGA